jgi:hypothetical protein
MFGIWNHERILIKENSLGFIKRNLMLCLI